MTYDPNEPRDRFGKWTSNGSGGPLDAATFKSYPNPNGDHRYIYHGTNVEHLREIAESGKLNTFKPSYGTWGQDVWPDGSKEKRAYFMGDTSISAAFTPEEGRPVLIRTKMMPGIKQEAYTRDFYSTKPIPASAIEYLANDGQWYPLTPGKPVRVKRTRNPLDRFPGIGGGADGSPVRSR